MRRRDFLKTTAATSLAAAGGLTAHRAAHAAPARAAASPFKLKYSATLGLFSRSHRDLLQRLERIRAEGFIAVENNDMKRMPTRQIEAYGKKLRELGMEHGIFVANRGVNGGAGLVDPKQHPIFIEELKRAIEVAPLVDAKFMTVCTGNELPGVPRDRQRQNVIDGLKKAADLLEPKGLTIVVEPLNVLVDHAGYFLARSDEAHGIMKAVASKSVKILFDIYHQQITEGNLTNNIRKYHDEIGYFQFADVPGRHEPWTGEINYRNVFKAIHALGYTSFVGLELGASKGWTDEGSLAVINAVRKADDF